MRNPSVDNYGKPKQLYFDRLAAMDEKALFEECKLKIWLSAYANNNPRSDYHWQVDACGDECDRRGRKDIYKKAYDETYKEVCG
jgi:hypothetical protein